MYSIAKAAALVACLCPNVLSVAVPAKYPRPEVPWKRDGLVGLSSGALSGAKGTRDSGCSNGPQSRSCWSDGFDVNTDMDEKWPTTGKTVTYNLVIKETTLSPDGVSKNVMAVNGQYPGPPIVADWGDTLEINVSNELTTNGTGIHWHGLRQLNSNQMDGTNGITECPIAPGQTKTYKFLATQYGTSWYHSHYSVQYAEGVVGPIMIRGPATANYDTDLGVMPITDWFHAPFFTVASAALHAAGPPTSDNILVNGSMKSPDGTAGEYAVTTLEPGKSHLLRFVNTGINNWIHVALDNHPFTVVAADFVPIVPYQTSSLSLAIGQRYDVIIQANQTRGNYWLRVGTGGGCDGPNANAANIRSIFNYNGVAVADPDSVAATPISTGCYDETVVPYVKTQVPSDTPKELEVDVKITAAQNNLVSWMINNSSILIDYDSPTLAQVAAGNTTFKANENAISIGQKDEWQYWVIFEDPATPSQALIPHPIHLHGHDFYVLDQAANTQWTGDISRLKTDNPIRRDVATLPAGGYLVLAFESDNPGAWLMHCHIPFHVQGGFALQFVERESEILSSIGSIDGLQQGCKSWKDYESTLAGGFSLEPGDSGLRR